MDTGWTIDHIMNMKATRFFAIRKGLLDVRHERMGHFYHEMTFVASAPNDQEYSENLRKHYKSWFESPETKRRTAKGRVFDLGEKQDFEYVERIFQSVRKYMR